MRLRLIPQTSQKKRIMLELDLGEGVLSQKNLSLKLQRVGQEYCDPKKAREHRKNWSYDSLHFVLYGRGTLVANGEKRTLSKGDIFLLYADEEYEYYPDPIDPWSYVWVDFSSDDTVALSLPCGLSKQAPVIHISDLTALMGLLKSIYESYDASALQQLNCSAIFLLILSELIKTASKKLPGDSSPIKHRHIRNIVTYINNNFRLPLTIREIATANRISVSRMMALFAELVGMSPIAYLNNFRISTACEMLRSSDTPIGEVASAVGVDDPLYFSRLFKKCKGVSPREYRAGGGANEEPFAWLKERNIDFR